MKESPPTRTPWLPPVVATLILQLLIVTAAGGTNWELSLVVLAAIAAIVIMLHRLFPGSRFFSITFANAIGVYACIYISFLEARFEGAGTLITVIGFMLPILGFATAAFLRREGIRSIILSEHPRIETRFGRAFLWIAPIILIGIFNFVLPLEVWSVQDREIWLLTAMALIALVVVLAGQSVAVFLLDTGLLFEDFYGTATRLIKPAFAFMTFYSLIVVVFATLYRLIDMFDRADTFTIAGAVQQLTFVESLYFSIVTLSTVGYGDIVPVSYAVRAVVALQIVAGIVLLLFGFQAVLRSARDD